ncbi:molybdenum cofactor guanylyltransferase [Halohasta salina]|uniref:molybdenum cofactor guanylyltransferase n=1 Tax=Halohasta salina TaxID=2961621 RepID=UPI0020A4998F|nr:molybdenum cofactor guanylyltransferase [Halohasta salina]
MGEESARPRADTGRAGVVLAGGRSERFPTVEKALAPLNGQPLVWHAVQSVTPAVDEVIVNCRRDQRAELTEALGDLAVRFAVDPVSDRGPVVGLRTALSETTATYAAVVPCDMPAVPAAFVDFLFARARHRTGAVARLEGERRPFPMVVHVRAATAACREVEAGGRSGLGAFLDHVDPDVVPERVVEAHVEPTAFRDVDTHADLAALRDR